MKISSKIKVMLRSLMLNAGSLVTDKGELLYEGDELEVGKEVFVTGEDGEIVAAEDGEYKVEGKTIVVAEGKVSEIREDEAQDEPAEEVNTSKQKFEKVRLAMEESYEDKERKIIEAIRALGFADSWLVEAGEDFAIVEVWNEEAGDYKHIRFDISWSEEGEATASNPIEVVSEFIPKEDEAKDEEIVEEQFAEEEGEAQPADEPEKTEEEIKSTEDKVADLEAAVGAIREGIEKLTNAIAVLAERQDAIEETLRGLKEPAAEPAEEGEETEVKASRLSYLRK